MEGAASEDGAGGALPVPAGLLVLVGDASDDTNDDERVRPKNERGSVMGLKVGPKN